ncbi:uncharacterized protein LOC107195637 [Pteropus alecto]|uniref:uncharacterized protein LOC107195637 n=1 Tax=Pteropus alecto TaxID=9402 RepID=UPI0007687BF4|nr:uncharacterized protein LOC107195637 [Pteropus alecto]XP_024902268.1 uncharacterized protein LOC107195637 [Pteropus alecto]XP_024902269.1 uncharacterized protein LOC107195637 [Pteropus alecto]
MGGERPETPPLAASWGLLREATGGLELGTDVSPWIPQGGKGQGLSQVACGGPWHRKPGVRAQRTVELIGRLFVGSLLCVVPCIRPWGCKSQPDISGCGWATAATSVDTAAVPGRGSREGCPGAQIHLPLKLGRTRKQIICLQPSQKLVCCTDGGDVRCSGPLAIFPPSVTSAGKNAPHPRGRGRTPSWDASLGPTPAPPGFPVCVSHTTCVMSSFLTTRRRPLAGTVSQVRPQPPCPVSGPNPRVPGPALTPGVHTRALRTRSPEGALSTCVHSTCRVSSFQSICDRERAAAPRTEPVPSHRHDRTRQQK